MNANIDCVVKMMEMRRENKKKNQHTHTIALKPFRQLCQTKKSIKFYDNAYCAWILDSVHSSCLK